MRNEIVVEVMKTRTNITLNGEKTYFEKTLALTFPNIKFKYASSDNDDYTIIAIARPGITMHIGSNEVNQCDGHGSNGSNMTAEEITQKIIEVCERVRDWYWSIPESKSSITLEIIE